MIKLKTLLETVELLDNGDLRISNIDDITTNQWELISRLMRQKGYDSRGADDAKRAISNFLNNRNNTTHDIIRYDIFDAWVDSIKTVLKIGKSKTPASTSYSPSKIIASAKRHFKTTTNLSLAGYILPDGSLLNFSASGYSRDRDHREISHVYNKLNISIGKNVNSTAYMLAFMHDCHAIRIGGSQSVVDIAHVPTRQQADQLLKFFSMYDGNVQVDVRDGAHIDGRTYNKGTSPKIILRDIVEFFKSGKYPIQNIRNSSTMIDPT